MQLTSLYAYRQSEVFSKQLQSQFYQHFLQQYGQDVFRRAQEDGHFTWTGKLQTRLSIQLRGRRASCFPYGSSVIYVYQRSSFEGSQYSQQDRVLTQLKRDSLTRRSSQSQQLNGFTSAHLKHSTTSFLYKEQGNGRKRKGGQTYYGVSQGVQFRCLIPAQNRKSSSKEVCRQTFSGQQVRGEGKCCKHLIQFQFFSSKYLHATQLFSLSNERMSQEVQPVSQLIRFGFSCGHYHFQSYSVRTSCFSELRTQQGEARSRRIA